MSIQDTLRQMVKDAGIDKMEKVVGNYQNLGRIAYNNDPMGFLNSFNDLDVVQSEQEPDWTLFRYKKGENLMIYDRKNERIYINYNKIWSFFETGFGLNYTETQDLIKIWLDEVHNLRGVTPSKNEFMDVLVVE